MITTVAIYEFRLTRREIEVLDEAGMTDADVFADAARVRDGGEAAREALLSECLDGADDERADAWRAYVSNL